MTFFSSFYKSIEIWHTVYTTRNILNTQYTQHTSRRLQFQTLQYTQQTHKFLFCSKLVYPFAHYHHNPILIPYVRFAEQRRPQRQPFRAGGDGAVGSSTRCLWVYNRCGWWPSVVRILGSRRLCQIDKYGTRHTSHLLLLLLHCFATKTSHEQTEDDMNGSADPGHLYRHNTRMWHYTKTYAKEHNTENTDTLFRPHPTHKNTDTLCWEFISLISRRTFVSSMYYVISMFLYHISSMFHSTIYLVGI